MFLEKDLGVLAPVQQDLEDLENLKRFFFTLDRLAIGQAETGDGENIELPRGLVFNVGVRLDCILEHLIILARAGGQEGKAP